MVGARSTHLDGHDVSSVTLLVRDFSWAFVDCRLTGRLLPLLPVVPDEALSVVDVVPRKYTRLPSCLLSVVDCLFYLLCPFWFVTEDRNLPLRSFFLVGFVHGLYLLLCRSCFVVVDQNFPRRILLLVDFVHGLCLLLLSSLQLATSEACLNSFLQKQNQCSFRLRS